MIKESVHKILIVISPDAGLRPAGTGLVMCVAVAGLDGCDECGQILLRNKLSKDVALDHDGGHAAAQKVLGIVGRHLNHLMLRQRVHGLLAGCIHGSAVCAPHIIEFLEPRIRALGKAIIGLQQILDVTAHGIAALLDSRVVAVEHLRRVGHGVLKKGCTPCSISSHWPDFADAL